MAIRASIGCGRPRMIRQLLTESLMLSLCGAAAGVGLAALVLHLFRSANLVELPPGNAVEMRWQVLLFAGALSVLCTLSCGVAPAWRASRTDLTHALKADARAGGAPQQRAARTLVVVEVALSLMLLSGAALLATSLARMAETPLGYRTDHLLTAEMDPGARPGMDADGLDADTEERLAEAVLARLSALPGVRSAAFTSRLMPSESEVLAVAGRAFDAQHAAADVSSQTVSARYFQTAEIPLLAGRNFSEGDRKATEAVAIINARLAQQYFPGGDAVGRRIKLGSPEDKTLPWLTVVGVVGNIKSTTVFQEMGYVTMPSVYRPMTQAPGASRTLFLRTAAEPMRMAEQLQQTAMDVDRDVVISHTKTMNAILHEQSAQPRFRTMLLGGFAGMALLLAALGIYGLLTQQVMQRTLEIGIRMALGANRRDVVAAIVRQALAVTGLGIALGLAGSLAAGRVMAAMLYETSASDPWLLSAVIAAFVLVALVASYVPAWRASRVEPMAAMRAE
jgi:predicted permease